MSLLNQNDKRYKKVFGSWGESCVDTWMHEQNWSLYRKNLKISGGEIDRIYQYETKNLNSSYCFSEIKTVFCKNRERFFSIFTEVGLSALIKQRQIVNLYKFSAHFKRMCLGKLYKTALLKQEYYKQNYDQNKIYIRFFIVLKMYANYEQEWFFQNQKNYKICAQEKDYLILSFTPEYRQ